MQCVLLHGEPDHLNRVQRIEVQPLVFEHSPPGLDEGIPDRVDPKALFRYYGVSQPLA
jgi:hypothetical protein